MPSQLALYHVKAKQLMVDSARITRRMYKFTEQGESQTVVEARTNAYAHSSQQCVGAFMVPHSLVYQ